MSAAGSQTGSFWICPKCRKHVPTRSQVCQCGFDRHASTEPVSNVSLRGTEPLRESSDSRRGWFPWAAVAALALVAGVYVAMRTPGSSPAPADTELARRLRRLREPPPPPQVVYVPVPVAPTASPGGNPLPEPVNGSDTSSPLVMPTAGVAPETAPAPPPLPPPESVPQESEVDAKRRAGAEEFDREIASLSRKADQADIAWQRYLSGCRENVTTATSVAGVADRDWLVFAGATVTTSQWTEACAEAGSFFALMRQVREGVCVAEDRARQHWVLPGVRRDIRHRYRLDWEGWDNACR